MAEKNVGSKFRLMDVGQIAVGACVLAFPTATTEEIWDLGAELPFGRVLLFALASFCFLGFFIYGMHHSGIQERGWPEFFKRILTTYGLTFFICALLLVGLDRLELDVSPLIGIKRTILVTFPASFAATVVDSMK